MTTHTITNPNNDGDVTLSLPKGFSAVIGTEAEIRALRAPEPLTFVEPIFLGRTVGYWQDLQRQAMTEGFKVDALGELTKWKNRALKAENELADVKNAVYRARKRLNDTWAFMHERVENALVMLKGVQ